MAPMIETLEALLARGEDSPQLRFALANQYASDNDSERALTHATVAVELDPNYSAAWRLLGQIQARLGDYERAMATFRKGIEVADSSGDMQVAREMRVFLARLTKDGPEADEAEA